MKSIMRTLSFVLVLVMLALPMGAFAEDAKLTSLTLDNISVGIGEQSFPIGLSTTFGVGMRDEDILFTGDVKSGASPIASFQAGYQDEVLTLAMDGLSDHYQITQDELEDLMEQSMSASGAAPIDPKQMEGISDVMESYVELIQMAAKMQEESDAMTPEQSTALMFEMFNIDPEAEAAEESVEVLGETMSLKHYKTTWGMADMDRIMATSMKAIPSGEEFFDKYMDLMEDVMEMSGENIQIDKDHLFSSLYGQLGADLTVDMDIWTDDAGENVRMDFVETITSTVGEDPYTVSIPFNMQMSTNDEAEHVLVTIDTDIEGAKLVMSIASNEYKVDGVKGDFSMDMSVAGPEGTVDGNVDMNIAATYTQDAEGDNRKFDGAMQVNDGNGNVAISLTVDGTGVLANGETTKDSVLVNVSVPMGTDAEPTVFALGFDLSTSQSELPQGAFIDTADKPVVMISQMDSEQTAKLEGELGTVGIMGYGALMADPGLAQLIGQVIATTSAATQAISGEDAEAVPTVADLKDAE